MEQLLYDIASGLVNDKSAINIEVTKSEDGTDVYHLRVADSEKGRVIGKHGKIAKAIRTIMKVRATKTGKKISVEIE